jgi:tetratricopeptide (TPR) repeat protein
MARPRLHGGQPDPLSGDSPLRSRDDGPESASIAADSYLTRRYLLPCVGRNSELLQLYRALEDARHGHGSAWAIVGPPGIGKSRVLKELGTIAERKGFHTRRGHGDRDASVPLYPLLQVFDIDGARTRSRRSDPTRELESLSGETREGNRSETRDSAPDASGRSARSGGPATPRVRRSTRSDVDRVLLRMIRELESESEPRLFLIDDFESADQETMRGFELLARSVASAPVVLVVGLRDTTPKLGGFRQFMLRTETSQRSGMLRVVRLDPLSVSDGMRVLQTYLGPGAKTIRDTPYARDVVARAGGNPYFILEIVDSDLRSGALVWRRGRWIVGSATGSSDNGVDAGTDVPQTVRTLVASRLEGLDPADQRLLRVAARIGVRFDPRPVAKSLSLSIGSVDLRLRRLAREGWPLRPESGESGTFQFDHALVREVLNDRLAFPVEPEVLDRLARWWKAEQPDDPLTEASLWAETSNVSNLIEAVERAIQRAMVERAYRQVPHLLQWLRSRLPRGQRTADRLGPVVLAAAQALRFESETDTLLETLAPLEGLQLPPDLEISAELMRIETRIRTNPVEAGRLLDEFESELISRLGGVPDAHVWRVAYLRGLLSVWDQTPRKAVETVRRAIACLPDRGCDEETLLLYESYIDALWLSGRRREGQAFVRQARRWVLSRRLTQSTVSLQLGEIEIRNAVLTGNWPEALRLARRQVDHARSTGNVNAEVRTLVTAAQHEYLCRETVAARKHIEEALELARRLELPVIAGIAYAFDGWIAIYDGDYVRAHDALRRAESSSMVGSNSIYHLFSRIGFAIVLAEQGDPAGALRELDELARTVGAERQALATELQLARARAYELAGDPVRSGAALREAWKTVEHQAAPPNRLNVAAEFLEWARRHGSAAQQRSWRRRYLNLCRASSLDPGRDWKGIAYPPSSAVPIAGPSIGTTYRAPPRTGFPGNAPFRELILKLLQQRPLVAGSRRASGRSSYLTTESDIAQSLGVPRERFARTLQRLLEEGSVERTRCRIEGRPRPVYAYRLASGSSRVILPERSLDLSAAPVA